ncbi:MAG: DEAD/DEAH box helicase [Proteobacteria bacterium]|jgi:ATP-dependent RNA helicase DeaD|nr:DEAD/DEAH box helicase [Desulfocapsa sp.]MBU3945902.1 DEAD/DEAH box helicase [Pseudomonadota bacterium]MCG2744795.1 DEAD/DEAH box helicase [Desulfobacteraceae bacterium]MBU3982045.1 DEAD/DEAH box helicase [Pseudomonadota bacterium]MBU4028858.1 DEAD/DEAH box helicase [Pseudomonadota bacterium]
MSFDDQPQTTFSDFAFSPAILKAIDDLGYESPTPIQTTIIPHVLAGADVVGQAQTGTGKTAAFALPLLSRLDLKKRKPQVLVLAPTRELAIQVAEAFHSYATHMKGFQVVPIYGGQDYKIQLRQLERGVHVVVGTPGRVMDHIRRKTLILDELDCLVLDEADEMLRMGFIDDVEWILEQTPESRQIALFSATMPVSIRRIAQKYLHNPQEITIKGKTSTAQNIRQRFLVTSGFHKLDSLTRVLEAESFEGMLIFVRTKNQTVELAEKLAARGYSVAPLNGDIPQNQRQRTVEQLKSGKLDILVATDVAARGLDVERISHVLNFDIPYDTESYIHRIGRTGRAGRSGEAILFVTTRERQMVGTIERATRQKIELMKLPSTETINDKRIMEFKQRITDALTADNLEFFQRLIEEYLGEHDVPADMVAAALASLSQGDTPLLLKDLPTPKPERSVPFDRPARGGRRFEKSDRPSFRERKEEPREFREAREFNEYRDPKKFREPQEAREPRPSTVPDHGMERFRIEVGLNQGVKPGNIVGAIANEADLSSKHIGRISIFEDHSTVDLPAGLPQETLTLLKKVKVADKQLKISRLDESKVQAHNPPAQVVRKTEEKTERRETALGRARRRGQMSAPSVAARKKRVKE